jgi:hypothetical protein
MMPPAMQIVAKASKSLAKDKPLGVGELNLVQVGTRRHADRIRHDCAHCVMHLTIVVRSG